MWLSLPFLYGLYGGDLLKNFHCSQLKYEERRTNNGNYIVNTNIDQLGEQNITEFVGKARSYMHWKLISLIKLLLHASKAPNNITQTALEVSTSQSAETSGGAAILDFIKFCSCRKIHAVTIRMQATKVSWDFDICLSLKNMPNNVVMPQSSVVPILFFE